MHFVDSYSCQGEWAELNSKGRLFPLGIPGLMHTSYLFIQKIATTCFMQFKNYFFNKFLPNCTGIRVTTKLNCWLG